MAHDHHFLSRLDRVRAEHLELALGLYRDAEVVRKIIAHARLPEGVERLAISLEHPREGPFVVVQSSGRFVTCLGAGMKTRDLPVVSRQELDHIATKVTTLREQLRLAREVAPTDSELFRLQKRIGRAGHAMPREDFAALALWSPMLWAKYLLGYLDDFEAADKQRLELLLYDGLRQTDDVLEEYWRSVSGMRHLALLATLGDAEPWTDIAGFLASSATTFTRPLASQRLMTHVMVIPWIAGHVGEALLPSYERAFLSEGGRVEAYDAVLGLAGLYAMNASLRPRVRTTFEEAKKRWADSSDMEMRLRSELAVVIEQLGNEPTELMAETMKLGAKTIVDARASVPKGSGLAYDDPQQVPVSYAFAALANTTIDWWDPPTLVMSLGLLPLLSTIQAEDFYLPRGLARAATVPWERALTIDLLTRPGKGVTRRAPKRVEAAPGRNDPCFCGSGKKYKKCHGA